LEQLLSGTCQRAQALGLVENDPEGVIDATGLETRHASRHYVMRRNSRQFAWSRWPKLTLVCHSRTHLFAAVVVGEGPSQDSPEFTPAVRQAHDNLAFDRLLGDAGYDGEHNHVLCREELGMRSTVIALNPRNTGRRWPQTKYRRLMKRPAQRKGFGQRWQIESAISRHKRRLGSALRNREDQTQHRECLLRVLTHNLMILR
jgi:hypothetical protein